MSARRAHFTAFLTGVGYHESAWKLADPADLAGPARFGVLERAALTAERGLLDAVFFADSPGLAIFRARYFPQVGFDPLELLAALSRSTTRVGLIATASTTYSVPYDLARRLATIDHLSGGRAGWNIVTTRYAGAAGNFGLAAHPDPADRYARAEEFVEVVTRLWDSGDANAAVSDQEKGIWADVDLIRPVDFHGRFFDVSGALTLPRSPQGRPAFAQAGSTFRQLADELTGLPGGLEFTGTPEQFADLIEAWLADGASDGFTLQPTTLPGSLERFTDHVVPILQARGLHRTEYTATTLRGHLRDDR